MTYRTEPCAYCDAPGQELCGRCGQKTCAVHGSAGQPHCSVCEKELRDDLDEIEFRHQTSTASEQSLASLVSFVGCFLAKRTLRKTFSRRSHQEIAAWRKRAGVVVRPRR